jgi:hypothetical protein
MIKRARHWKAGRSRASEAQIAPLRAAEVKHHALVSPDLDARRLA